VKAVPNVPSHEEFFGLTDNFIDDDEFESDNSDDDVRKMIVVMLALLQEFYILHMYDSEYYFSSEQFNDDIRQFNSELKDNLLVLFTEYMNILTTNLDVKWNIPTGTVTIPLELKEIIDTGVDSVTNTLYYDLLDKAVYYTELSMTTGAFSPHGNFRRAIKRLTNQVTFKGHSIRKIIERKYDEFVYGQEALGRWVCSGVNTCAWCYEIEAMGAMPLSWFPIDHINGNCRIVMENPNVYSEEYNMIRRE